jgi:hypothetical protein
MLPDAFRPAAIAAQFASLLEAVGRARG